MADYKNLDGINKFDQPLSSLKKEVKEKQSEQSLGALNFSTILESASTFNKQRE